MPSTSPRRTARAQVIRWNFENWNVKANSAAREAQNPLRSLLTCFNMSALVINDIPLGWSNCEISTTKLVHQIRRAWIFSTFIEIMRRKQLFRVARDFAKAFQQKKMAQQIHVLLLCCCGRRHMHHNFNWGTFIMPSKLNDPLSTHSPIV